MLIPFKITARSCAKTVTLKILTSSNESAYFRGHARTRDGLAFYIMIYGIPIYSSIYRHGIHSSDMFALALTLSLLVRLAGAKSRGEPFTLAQNLRWRLNQMVALNQKQDFCRESTRLREQSTGWGASPSPVVITMKKEEVNVARRRAAFPRLPLRQEGRRAYLSCIGEILRNYKF